MPRPLRILFTGGRAPATLEWARLCRLNGHSVWLAECMPWTITSFSTAIEQTLHVPSPRHRYTAFIQQLLVHIKTHKIDILIPTCEEVFWIAKGKESLEAECEVFTPALQYLRPMHSKIDFLDIANAARVCAPQTHRICTREDLRKHMNNCRNLVFKPEFSRFGTQVLMRPSADRISRIQPTPSHPWAAQECIDGQQFATWSLCREGRVLAHSAYPIEHRAGVGSAVFFRAIQHPAIFQCVQRIVAHTKWTGQIAFDFIVPEHGAPHVLECNPRLTSGIHLFRNQPEITDLFDGDIDRPLYHPKTVAIQLCLPMILYALPHALIQRNLRQWWLDFSEASDAIWCRQDPWPTIGQWLSVLALLLRALRLRTDPLSASTHDIEWNGDS